VCLTLASQRTHSPSGTLPLARSRISCLWSAGSPEPRRRMQGQVEGQPNQAKATRTTSLLPPCSSHVTRTTFTAWAMGMNKFHSRGNNSWYPVCKRPWYPVDILDIRLLDSVLIRSKHDCFQQFFNIFTPWPLSTDIWLIFMYIQQIFLIFCWNLSDIWLKFGQFSLDIRLFYLWCPTDILISGVQISSKMVLLGSTRPLRTNTGTRLASNKGKIWSVNTRIRASSGVDMATLYH